MGASIGGSKTSHVGAPAIYELDLACADLNAAFGGLGCYLVGSAITKPDWRDVDIRLILSDDDFVKLFPASQPHRWEDDVRWLLMTVSISQWLSKRTGLPVDFQFQAQTRANQKYDGTRHALGLSRT